jgi:hypothetical protein
VWFYHGVHAQADAAHTHQTDQKAAQLIDRALQAFGRARTEQHLEGGDDKEFGVTAPETFIMAYRAKELEPIARYAVGDVAPDKVSRYVLIVGRSGVITIPNYQIQNLLDLIQAVGGRPGEPSTEQQTKVAPEQSQR